MSIISGILSLTTERLSNHVDVTSVLLVFAARLTSLVALSAARCERRLFGSDLGAQRQSDGIVVHASGATEPRGIRAIVFIQAVEETKRHRVGAEVTNKTKTPTSIFHGADNDAF
jgi:hypothetical protein